MSALFFLLMVVQTFRMKIQEPPVSCDAGRVGGGDPDCDKPSCEDVPRLDLTALTEENHWGGRPPCSRSPSGCMFLAHAGLFNYYYLIPKHPPTPRTKSVEQPALHMGVRAAAAQAPLLRPSAHPLLSALQDLTRKDPLRTPISVGGRRAWFAWLAVESWSLDVCSFPRCLQRSTINRQRLGWC